MRRAHKIIVAVLLTLVPTLGYVRLAGAPSGDLPILIPPVLVTACGQGPGASQVAESCERLGIICRLDSQLRMGDLGAICCADAGCPFGGVLMVVADVDEGAMRALDVDLAFEIARCRVLVERGKELGMAIIVALLDSGGELPPTEDLELFSQFVAMADLAVVPCGISAHAFDDRIPVLALGTSADLEAVLRTLFAP